jgi:hypothetical protein
MKRTQQLDPIRDRGRRFRGPYKRQRRRAERRTLARDFEANPRRAYFGYSS